MMRKLSKVITVTVMAAFVALCLAACGGSSSAGGSAASSGSSAASYDPIYVVKHVEQYVQTLDENGAVVENEKSGFSDYEYDERGNRTQWTVTMTNPNTNENQTNKYTYSNFDENGYAGSSVAPDGTQTTMQWTIEDGHAVKSVSTLGSTIEYTYYADGKMKSQHIVYDDGRDITVEFDENGRQAHQVTIGGDHPQTYDYEWTLDDQGHAVGMKRTITMTNTGEVVENEFTYDLDENGNASTVYMNGAVSAEVEYQKIDNPSTNAWVTSWVPQF